MKQYGDSEICGMIGKRSHSYPQNQNTFVPATNVSSPSSFCSRRKTRGRAKRTAGCSSGQERRLLRAMEIQALPHFESFIKTMGITCYGIIEIWQEMRRRQKD